MQESLVPGSTSSPAVSGAIRFRGGPRQVSRPQFLGDPVRQATEPAATNQKTDQQQHDSGGVSSAAGGQQPDSGNAGSAEEAKQGAAGQANFDTFSGYVRKVVTVAEGSDTWSWVLLVGKSDNDPSKTTMALWFPHPNSTAFLGELLRSQNYPHLSVMLQTTGNSATDTVILNLGVNNDTH